MSSTASAILAAAGVDEDPSYYGSFQAERERAVLTVPIRIQDAWLRNDADAFADVFTPDGSVVMQSRPIRGREQIRAYMADGFRGGLRGAHVKGWPIDVRFLSEDVAMVVTEGGIRMPGETETAPERRIVAVWMVVRWDREWRLLSHESTPLYPPSRLRALDPPGDR